MAASRVPVKLWRKSISAGLASSGLMMWRGGTRKRVSGACLLLIAIYSSINVADVK